MITFTHCSLAGNSRDVTIKHVHSEKHSDVKRRVVAVFQIAAFDITGRDCLKWYAVLLIVHPKIRRLIFIEIDVHLGSALNCREKYPSEITVPYTCDVSVERGTIRLTRSWNRLGACICQLQKSFCYTASANENGETPANDKCQLFKTYLNTDFEIMHFPWVLILMSGFWFQVSIFYMDQINNWSDCISS